MSKQYKTVMLDPPWALSGVEKHYATMKTQDIIGLVLGVYSSLFVASPIEMGLKEREQRWAEIRTRLVNKGVDISDTHWHDPKAAVATVSTAGGAPSATRPGEAPPLSVNVGGHPPRPRKKKRR